MERNQTLPLAPRGIQTTGGARETARGPPRSTSGLGGWRPPQPDPRGWGRFGNRAEGKGHADYGWMGEGLVLARKDGQADGGGCVCGESNSASGPPQAPRTPQVPREGLAVIPTAASGQPPRVARWREAGGLACTSGHTSTHWETPSPCVPHMHVEPGTQTHRHRAHTQNTPLHPRAPLGTPPRLTGHSTEPRQGGQGRARRPQNPRPASQHPHFTQHPTAPALAKGPWKAINGGGTGAERG